MGRTPVRPSDLELGDRRIKILPERIIVSNRQQLSCAVGGFDLFRAALSHSHLVDVAHAPPFAEPHAVNTHGRAVAFAEVSVVFEMVVPIEEAKDRRRRDRHDCAAQSEPERPEPSLSLTVALGQGLDADAEQPRCDFAQGQLFAVFSWPHIRS